MSNDSFKRAEEQFLALKKQLAAKRITQEHFDAAMQQLVIQDAYRRHWTIGPASGKWHVYDGKNWVEADPSLAADPSAIPIIKKRMSMIDMLPFIAASVIALLCTFGIIFPVLTSNQGLIQISQIGLTDTSAVLPNDTITPTLAPTTVPSTTTPLPSSTIDGNATAIALASIPTLTATAIPSATPIPPTATSTWTPSATLIPPTATATSTSTSTSTPTATPTSTYTATPTSTPTSTSTPTPTATSTPTRTPTPTPTPTNTPIPPSPTPTPIPPGLYTTNLRLDPPMPQRGDDVNFYVTFLNTTSRTQIYRWLVYLYRVDNLRNSMGETTPILTEIPVGTIEQKSASAFHTGLGLCEDFIARIAWLDENHVAHFFLKPDGNLNGLFFSVCQ